MRLMEHVTRDRRLAPTRLDSTSLESQSNGQVFQMKQCIIRIDATHKSTVLPLPEHKNGARLLATLGASCRSESLCRVYYVRLPCKGLVSSRAQPQLIGPRSLGSSCHWALARVA